MFRPCGRAPSYSGRCIARAVELYQSGVKPGYMRWDELQTILEKEFPQEFPVRGHDRPSPETVLKWVRKYPDAGHRLQDLGVQQVGHGQGMSVLPDSLSHQLAPAARLSYAGSTGSEITALFHGLIAIMVVVIMVRVAWSLSEG